MLATVFEMDKTMPRKVTASAPETAAQPVVRKTGKVGRPPRAAYTEPQISLLTTAEDTNPAEDDEESGERKVEGKRLITLIKRTLIDRNLPDRYIADLMGVTTIYWNSMCNGHRKIKSVGKDKLERVGQFLGIPTVQVMILADYFEPTDFYAKRSLDDELNMVLQAMQADPSWVALTPSRAEWDQLPVGTKILIALLFEREAGRIFMSKLQMEHPALAKKLGMEEQKDKAA
jgi:transcriptional regulator with XRE-family HTH domain